MRKLIESQIDKFGHFIEALGGRWESPTIEESASEAELKAIEVKLGRPIPANLREFAGGISRRIYFDWSLPDGFDLPENLNEVFGGGLDYDISQLPEHEQGRASWQKECFPNPDDSYDVVWHNKIGFHDVPNGDYLAIAPDGKIIYLSHDDGGGHGYAMASSFSDLIQRWLPLGCPGPEDWQWLPFVADSVSGIDPDCESAKAWMTAITSNP